MKAFELQALDYLLKPFDRERFTRSIERTREALKEPDHSDVEERVRRLLAQIPGRPATAQQILIKDTDRAFFLSVDDIQRVSAAGNYVEVHARGKVHLVRDTLTTFIAQLDPSEFLRVHRSHVVRINFIAEMRPLFHGDYELVLKDGADTVAQPPIQGAAAARHPRTALATVVWVSGPVADGVRSRRPAPERPAHRA